MRADLAPSTGKMESFFSASSVFLRVKQMSFFARHGRPCRWFIFLCLLVQLLGGCAPGNIVPHAVAVNPQALNTENVFSASLSTPWPDEAWWEVYGDPQLNKLVRLAVAQSPTLRIAEARVRQASGAAQASGAGMLPCFSTKMLWERK